MEGNLRFKIDWASLIVGRKFTVFILLYFVFEGNFQEQAPGGLIFWRAIQRRVFCVTSLGDLYLEGLIQGGPYFRNFTVFYFGRNSMLIFDVPFYMKANFNQNCRVFRSSYPKQSDKIFSSEWISLQRSMTQSRCMMENRLHKVICNKR